MYYLVDINHIYYTCHCTITEGQAGSVFGLNVESQGGALTLGRVK